MVQVPPVPHHFTVLPSSVLRSLGDRGPGDALAKQRKTARSVMFECFDIYNEYFETGSHPLITPEIAVWGLNHGDHTSLRQTRNEDAVWMTRMAVEATGPIKLRGPCMWDDEEKVKPVLEILKDHPDIRINVVTNFPHGWDNPDKARRNIERIAGWLKDLKNPRDIDTVIHYLAWMDGDVKKVRAILDAEGRACRDNGFTWKSIQKVSVHAYASKNKLFGDDFFKSVYSSTMEALEAGADCAKTSTGEAAAPPFNDFVSVDVGYITHSAPMLMALKDFNKKNKDTRWPKFSGGNRSEADVAVNRYATDKILGPRVAEKMVIGAGYRLRTRELQFIAEQQGAKTDPKITEALQPWGVDVGALPQHRLGLPDPALKAKGASVPAARPKLIIS